jgi:hypothetical protein
MADLELSQLLVSSKQTEVEYPGIAGFKVNVSFLSREELVKIRKKATTTKWKNRIQSEELNEDLFLQLYVSSTVKGWSGLKLKDVAKLAPIDLSAQNDPEAELKFSETNALALMKASTEFDSFISETVSDLSNFQ